MSGQENPNNGMHLFSRHKYTYVCSFCSKDQDQVQRLIAGPGGVYVCNECVALFVNESPEPPLDRLDHRCSFCGKAQSTVKWAKISSIGVVICDECVSLCKEILEEEQKTVRRPGDAGSGTSASNADSSSDSP
jgi:ATP-dependent protease Clp ATPase subunit